MNDSRERSPIIVILLSLVTCGLYTFYWIYKMSEELQNESGKEDSISPGIELLLVIVTCGIYLFFWYYKYAKMILEIQVSRNISTPDDNAILYIILIIFGLSPIAMAIMQSSANKLWMQNENSNY